MFFREKRVPERDVSEASLEEILSRFANEAAREEKDAQLHKAIASSVLYHSLSGETLFRADVFPPDTDLKGRRVEICEKHGLILLGALLTGRTNPTDREKFDEIYCGEVLKEENTIGFLSGRKGTSYKPFSQCWLVATELQKLVGFMKAQTRPLPVIGESPVSSEEELSELLLKRKAIKRELAQKGNVILTWKEIMEKFCQTIREVGFPLLDSETAVNKSKELTKFSFDPSLQFDIGGEEYKRLVGWVEKRVLDPLINLVGEKNFVQRSEDGSLKWFASLKKTSDTCQKAPREEFSGVMS